MSEGQYLLADAGYGGSSWVLTPYRQPLSLIDRNMRFNELFSSARVLIEHVNGILKSRFSSLRELRIQIKEQKDLSQVNKWILVCCILHNLLMLWKDEWEGDLDPEDFEGPNLDIGEHINGNSLRTNIQNYVLHYHGLE